MKIQRDGETIGPFIREKISHGLLWPRLIQAANIPYKWYKIYVHGLFNPRREFKPRLILTEEFWVGLIQGTAYLGRESVRINGTKTLSATC